VYLDWESLAIPEGVEIEIEIDGQSDEFALEGEIVEEADVGVTWELPPTGWVMGRLVWPIEEPAGVLEAEEIPGVLDVKVLPSPLGSSKIILVSDRPAEGSIDLYDTSGRRVSHLGWRRLQAGENRFDLAEGNFGGHLADGVYFLRLSSISGTVTRRVVIAH
jgi:hypothetical protein